MTTAAADPAEASTNSTAADLAEAGSPRAPRSSGTMNQAWRWMVAGVILVIAVGTQLIVDLTNSSGLHAADFAGNYWFQLVVVAAGLSLVVCGIVKSRRH